MYLLHLPIIEELSQSPERWRSSVADGEFSSRSGTGFLTIAMPIIDAPFQQHSLKFLTYVEVIIRFQLGGTALVVHPRHVLAATPHSVYELYKVRYKERLFKSYKAMSEMMTTSTLELETLCTQLFGVRFA